MKFSVKQEVLHYRLSTVRPGYEQVQCKFQKRTQAHTHHWTKGNLVGLKLPGAELSWLSSG